MTTSPFARPFRIGTLVVPNRAVLAPMAGLTISAYRRHMKTHGVGLVTTEMVSAHGILHHNVRTGAYLDFVDEERPVAVQLFGDTPEAMSAATDVVLAREQVPDVVDINMGCPVRKVIKTGAGAALLADPDRAVAMAAAVVREATPRGIPVTVKLRSGLKAGQGAQVVVLARRLEEVGVAAICIHPRTADQLYRGTADHSLTASLVGSLSIPVLASGDIHGFSSALAVHESTGAAAVMLARGVAGTPWAAEDLLTGVDRPRPSLEEVVADLRALIARVAEERGPERAARWARKLLSWYLRPSGVPAAVIEGLRLLPDAVRLDGALQGVAISLHPPMR